MKSEPLGMRTDLLLAAVLAYTAASLFHFTHNAEFLDDYPNMPAWLTRARVYGAWLGVSAVGALGVALVVARQRLVGLSVLAVYALLGFDGLAHYSLAPVAAHTVVMNLSIWLEVLAAAALLAVVALSMSRLSRDQAHGAPD
jgi:hypothetical protein